MTAATIPAVRIQRTINATPERVFDAWLDAKSLATWMHPGDPSDAVATVDARVGGAFSVNMPYKGGWVMHTGAYKAIERPRTLAFTWISKNTDDGETLVTVEFRAGTKPKHTEVVLTHERLPQPQMEGHRNGWTRILDLLAERMEQQS